MRGAGEREPWRMTGGVQLLDPAVSESAQRGRQPASLLSRSLAGRGLIPSFRNGCGTVSLPIHDSLSDYLHLVPVRCAPPERNEGKGSASAWHEGHSFGTGRFVKSISLSRIGRVRA
jgi:hypothetical protein